MDFVNQSSAAKLQLPLIDDKRVPLPRVPQVPTVDIEPLRALSEQLPPPTNAFRLGARVKTASGETRKVSRLAVGHSCLHRSGERHRRGYEFD